ncbi:MAG: twin-arginine translocation signal domain-containing protein [Methanoregulaceae archaeon]|nr:twin-arginine translocation signal domain-containing protein [Methanoregulaceae archaeon]
MDNIARRQFLKGAAAVAGATAIGALPQLAQSATKPLVVPTLLLWDGTRFVEARSTRATGAAMGQAEIEIEVYGSPTRLRGIDQVVRTSGGEEVAFKAWTAPPSGATRVRFEADVREGLHLRLQLIDGEHDLVVSSAQLAEGVYVLSFGNLRGFSLDENADGGPVINGQGSLRRGYVILRISRS